MNKKMWLKSLKVGDTVCDCQYKHQKIVSLEEVYQYVFPWIIRQIIFRDFWPDSIYKFLNDSWMKFVKFFNYKKLADKDLVLENGSHCSAKHCCDEPNHQWKHNDE